MYNTIIHTIAIKKNCRKLLIEEFLKIKIEKEIIMKIEYKTFISP
jgi:hypothetical protein